MAVTDLTGTTWQFVDNYSEWSEYPFQEFNYAINFTSNGNNYTLLASDARTSGYTLLYDTTTVYGPLSGAPSWTSQNYRTIEITGGTDATNATLIAWLQANAVQQGGGGETTITYGGNTIATLSAGQTFTSSGLANKLTSTDIVITANGVSGEKTAVTYNGNTLFNQQSGTYKIPANNIIPYEFAVAYSGVPTPESFITFSSPDAFTIATYNNIKRWDGTIEYSTNKTNWATWIGTSAISATNSGSDYRLYMRGIGNTYVTNPSADPENQFIITGSNVRCYGDIGNLFDYQTVANTGKVPTSLSTHGLTFAFYGQSALISPPSFASFDNVELPYLSSTELGFFTGVFDGTSITSQPESFCPKNISRACFMRFLFTTLSTAVTWDFSNAMSIDYHGIAGMIVNKNSTAIFSNKLQSVYPGDQQVGSILGGHFNNLIFKFEEGDAVSFEAKQFISNGTSKITETYNVYTNNSTIKNSVLSKVGSYTIVNVYHLDGSAW